MDDYAPHPSTMYSYKKLIADEIMFKIFNVDVLQVIRFFRCVE